jgi:Flp pilus assembly protein TadD
MATSYKLVLGVLIAVLVGACSSTQQSASIPAPGSLPLEQLYQEGRIAYEAGRFDEAVDKFARVVQSDPLHLKALINWGAALARSGNIAEAILKYQQALTLDPNSAEAYYNWGVALERLGHHQEAVDKYNIAVALKTQILTPELDRYLQRQRARLQENQIKSVPAKPSTSAPPSAPATPPTSATPPAPPAPSR